MSRVLKLDHDADGLNKCTQYCGDTASTITEVKPENGDNACSFDFDPCTDELFCNNCCSPPANTQTTCPGKPTAAPNAEPAALFY